MNKKILQAVLRYLILIVVFVAAFLLIRAFYENLTTSTYEAPLPPVETTFAEERTLYKTIMISGYVEPEETVAVVPYVDGTILEFLLREGDKVAKGEVLARIDPEPYELQLAQAKAAYEAYESSYQRVSSLYQRNSVSQQEYDTVKAQRDAYKAQLDLAKLQLSYTEVTAKEAGTIQKKLASKGSAASTGTPIAVIADMDSLVVNVNIAEQYYDLFRDASALSVTVTRPASSYSAEVSTPAEIVYISPYIDPTSKNFQMQVKLEENLSAFTGGMYVKVYITYDSQTGAALPSRVRKLDGSAYYVEEGRAVYADLSGVFSDGSYFIVPEVLADKEFILRGQDSVLSGERVNVLREAEE